MPGPTLPSMPDRPDTAADKASSGADGDEDGEKSMKFEVLDPKTALEALDDMRMLLVGAIGRRMREEKEKEAKKK